MKKVGICGHFGGNTVCLDGQTVKTKIITSELQKKFGNDQVETADTHGGVRRIFRHLAALYRMAAACENIIILPACKGIQVFAPYLAFLKRLKSFRAHYVVIGGWLPSLLNDKPYLTRSLKAFDGIYVETSGMKDKLQKSGLSNIYLMKNCKNLDILDCETVNVDFTLPYPLCTFSRVTPKKGIEDAIECVQKVNSTLGYTAYQLDIYGQIDPAYKERFSELQKSFPSFIRYKGLVPYDQTTAVLRDYFALLFPTHYFTEGIPGTFIDAYAAGVPVISAKWENYDDIAKENITGLGYEFENSQRMEDILLDCIRYPDRLLNMRSNCLQEAACYVPSETLGQLFSMLEV